MTITLNLEPEIEKGLLAQATTRGVSLAEYVNQIVVREAHIPAEPSQPRTGQDLIDAGAKIRGLLTDEEVDTIFSRIADRLGADPDLSQRALEALAAQEYRLGHLNKPDLRRLLGFETSYEIDGFLKSHNVFDEYTIEDFQRERQALKSLGF